MNQFFSYLLNAAVSILIGDCANSEATAEVFKEIQNLKQSDK